MHIWLDTCQVSSRAGASFRVLSAECFTAPPPELTEPTGAAASRVACCVRAGTALAAAQLGLLLPPESSAGTFPVLSLYLPRTFPVPSQLGLLLPPESSAGFSAAPARRGAAAAVDMAAAAAQLAEHADIEARADSAWRGTVAAAAPPAGQNAESNAILASRDFAQVRDRCGLLISARLDF